jgi:hypothetical protein
MAAEIGPIPYTTGATLYALVFQRATGSVRDVAAGAWDAWADADIGDYDVALTEIGTASGVYQANAPSDLTLTTDAYEVIICVQAGGSPAVTDLRIYAQTIGAEDVDMVAIGGDAQSATDLKDFADAGYDPATNKVQGVVLVDTTTTNSDMRGTDSAALATHWTSTRAGYVDKLNVSGTIAHSDAANTYKADVSSLATAANLATLQTTATSILEDTEEIGTNGAGLTALASATDLGSLITTVGVAGAGLTNINLPDQAMNITGNITGNISGSVGSVTGAVGSVTGAVGSVTGNVGGNVTGSVGSVLGGIDTTSGTIKTLDALNTAQNAQHSTTQTDLQTLLNRIGAWTGSGVNTILGAFKALLSKAASTPSDIGGTFDASTDSTEAIRDRGDAAYTTATGFSTFNAGSDTVTVGAFNTSAKAELQQEAADALTAYDPATGTEAAALQMTIDDIQENIGDNGDALTQVPWSAAFGTGAQTAAAAALTAYDPPTNAEMEARTLPSADYFNATDDRVKLHATQGDYAPAKAGDAMALTTAYDVYHADIKLNIDDANSQDEYTITWFKNGVRITSGITSPTLQVVKRSDGTDLIASTTPTEIASTGSYKHDATTTARMTAGQDAMVIVTATIDASSRTFATLVGRDSSA